MLAYARAPGVTYYAQNYASIIRQPLMHDVTITSIEVATLGSFKFFDAIKNSGVPMLLVFESIELDQLLNLYMV